MSTLDFDSLVERLGTASTIKDIEEAVFYDFKCEAYGYYEPRLTAAAKDGQAILDKYAFVANNGPFDDNQSILNWLKNITLSVEAIKRGVDPFFCISAPSALRAYSVLGWNRDGSGSSQLINMFGRALWGEFSSDYPHANIGKPYYQNFIDRFSEFSKVNDNRQLKKFARLVHTIGNFMDGPRQGRLERSNESLGYFSAQMDCFNGRPDMLLSWLYGYGKGNVPASLHNEEVRKQWRDWIGQHKEAYLLDCYFDSEGKPISLDGRGSGSRGQQLDRYLRTVNSLIEFRGLRIVERLNPALTGNRNFQKRINELSRELPGAGKTSEAPTSLASPSKRMSAVPLPQSSVNNTHVVPASAVPLSHTPTSNPVVPVNAVPLHTIPANSHVISMNAVPLPKTSTINRSVPSTAVPSSPRSDIHLIDEPPIAQGFSGGRSARQKHEAQPSRQSVLKLNPNDIDFMKEPEPDKGVNENPHTEPRIFGQRKAENRQSTTVKAKKSKPIFRKAKKQPSMATAQRDARLQGEPSEFAGLPRYVKDAFPDVADGYATAFGANPIACLSESFAALAVVVAAFTFLIGFVELFTSGLFAHQISHATSELFSMSGFVSSYKGVTSPVYSSAVVRNATLLLFLLAYLLAYVEFFRAGRYDRKGKPLRIMAIVLVAIFVVLAMIPLVLALWYTDTNKHYLADRATLKSSESRGFLSVVNLLYKQRGLVGAYIVALIIVLILLIVFPLFLKASRKLVGFVLLSAGIVYAAVPLAFLLIENLIPLVYTVIALAVFALIFWLVVKVGNVSDSQSESSSSTSHDDRARKPSKEEMAKQEASAKELAKHTFKFNERCVCNKDLSDFAWVLVPKGAHGIVKSDFKSSNVSLKTVYEVDFGKARNEHGEQIGRQHIVATNLDKC
ncbi:hypothetical protein [Bifidobacterium sp. ESL0764]|uniref:hypothetical protein n=1 Tax=Bifidobacterium sp. ESL0764 TaxID=2983228 RepID=UPI0023F70719|nr:hypothetical protein [Bifidobacterium sp. ESL0764]WEV65587.1 hypothetical protein OZX71_07525 [Bifidobacterium sp. ESL0764]